MLQRKIRDQADAQACLANVSASGLTRVAWAHKNGVNASSLNAWRLAMARTDSTDAAAPTPLRLVELVASEPARPVTYLVRCGAMTVEVDAGFEADVLRRLLLVVASC